MSWLWLVIDLVAAFMLCALMLVSLLAFILFKNRQAPFDSALAALSDSNDGIEVKMISNGTVFSPQEQSDLGLVYLPGALVDARAYAPLCRDVAERSRCIVVLLDVPFRMATFGISRISKAMSEVPGVIRWTVGGHSLGGIAAAKYVWSNVPAIGAQNAYIAPLVRPEVVGLMLHAAPLAADAKSIDLSGHKELLMLHVLADRDGIVSDELITLSKANEPQHTIVATIAGGNHAGFGHYGPQTFPLQDGVSTIGLAEQQRQVADVSANWLKAISQRVEPCTSSLTA